MKSTTLQWKKERSVEFDKSTTYERSIDDQDGVTEQLDLLRRGLANTVYPGYPRYEERFVANPALLDRDEYGCLLLPAGPWNVDAHPSQPVPEAVPSLSRQQELHAAGYVLDAYGRPLHPWFDQMVSDLSLGVAMGKGMSWEWGPNPTADLVVIKNDHVLLVQRGDTGQWALPGGYVNTGESPELAGCRELTEETGLQLSEAVSLTEVYQGPVADIRATAHAWQETTAFAVYLADDGVFPDVQGRNEVPYAAWVPLATVQTGIELFGSHEYLLGRALDARWSAGEGVPNEAGSAITERVYP